jgi:hypothetical protein
MSDEKTIDAEFTSEQPTTLAVVDKADYVPGFVLSLSEVKKRLDEFKSFVSGAMVEGEDYGAIPGAGKHKVLLKPGAEKLLSFGGFATDDPIFVGAPIEDWQNGFFAYTIAIPVRSKRTGIKECTGIGHANSRESKWAYRWVPESQIPAGVNKDELVKRDSRREEFEFKFAVEKAETTGQYGKPAEYWARWKAAIESGEAKPGKRKTKKGAEYDGYSMAGGGVEYRIPNPDIFDLVNTILKMAKKRALVDGAIQAMRAATDFTQDVEKDEESHAGHDSYAEAFGDEPAPLPVESFENAAQCVATQTGGTVLGDITPETQGDVMMKMDTLREAMLRNGLTVTNFNNFCTTTLKGKELQELSESDATRVIEQINLKLSTMK